MIVTEFAKPPVPSAAAPRGARDAAQTHRHGAPAPRRSAARIVGEALLSGAALIGFACIVLAILAAVFNVSLIMFRTGSMAPTIPAGSVAVVQRVPAAQLQVGEVVTVDRDGQLPVTHRITAIEPGERSTERILRMQGDANKQEDLFPYTVDSGRRVMFSIPGVAPVIVQLSQPWLLGTLTVAAAGLVGWAFWPASTKTTRTESAGRSPQ